MSAAEDEDLDRAAARFRLAAETFERVRGLAPAAREAALAERCRGDPDLLVEIRALLSFHDRPSETLDSPILRSGIGATIGRYRIESVLGEGGMGKVYRAAQEEPVRREVALKVIKLGMDTRQVVRRFEAERQALARMEHPNVARVLDAGATGDGRPYFVMELVRGASIVAHCDARRDAIETRLRLFLDVCSAVQHAHQKGVIHRDLKPSNILVAEVDGRAIPKVIDFGVAKALEPGSGGSATSTLFGEVVGTPDFMSPEQAAGGDADARSDVFGLGVVLYELVVGTTPLRARLAADRPGQPVPRLDELKAIVRGLEAPRPSDAVAPDAIEARAAQRGLDARAYRRVLRGDLSWILLKALARDPARRYGTVAALAEDLVRLLHGDGIEARPPSAAYRLRTLVRRHAGILAAVAAIIVALSIGLLVALRAQARESAARAVLVEELFRRDVDRGRLRSHQGHLAEARDLLWTAHLARPASLEARWALRELLWTHGPFTTIHLDTLGSDDVRGLAFSADGRSVVVALDGRTPVELDRADGAIRSFEGAPARPTSLALLPDAGLLVCGDEERTATLWRLAERRHLRDLRPALLVAPAARVAAGGPRDLLFVDSDGTIVAADVDGRRPELALGTVAATSIASGPRGLVAIGDADGGALIVDGEGRVARVDAHPEPVRALAFDPAGTMLATVSTARAYRVVALEGGRELVAGRVGPGTITGVAFSADGRDLLLPGRWDTLAIDLSTGATRTGIALHGRGVAVAADGAVALAQIEPSFISIVEPRPAALTPPDGLLVQALAAGGIAVGEGGGMLRAVAIGADRTARPMWAFPAPRPRVVALSPDRTLVASIEVDRRVLVRAVADGSVVAEAGEAILGEHGTLRFEPDGRGVLFAMRDNAVARLDLVDGSTRELRLAAPSEVLCLAVAPDGRRIATSLRSRITTIVDRSTGAERVVETTMPVFSGAFSPDGATLALGSWRGDLILVDAADGTVRVARGHSALLTRIAWHPRDPTLLLTSSDDGSVRVWRRDPSDGAALELAMLEPFGARQPLRTAGWDETGGAIIVAGPTGAFAVYRIDDADRAIDASRASESARLRAP